ncbi:SDR family NAD(P)-dependent oxidoreductase [Roseibium sediminicola]|uniref:SDR family NAD(P)-dependent oxidoreductase n=1 Tax=Roseibium sediminicola TaxID=2933272 RepID=A0ABT0GZX0_9HYPH|nr:SDR family NAD(P)-dependent oxidoreductase [Roseibium sp. CAU 1639]MCK7614971.1 SDR family NAD(P)-dependent oxidoreductase [Roseibium sp. CAU 1639]
MELHDGSGLRAKQRLKKFQGQLRINNMRQKVAVVTGAAQGLGLETARQLLERRYHVVLTARDEPKLHSAVSTLTGDVSAFRLDVTSEADALALSHHVAQDFGHLDVLINNAGAFFEPTNQEAMVTTEIATTPLSAFENSFCTKALSAVVVTSALLPLLRQSSAARVVNVSTAMASLVGMARGWPAYRISKTALNAVTRIQADEYAGLGIKVNSVSPGWVRTAMGGPTAMRSVEEGADVIVWAATLPDDGPTGGFFESRQTLPW